MANDATYIAIIIGLFVLAFALVGACDRIIGSEDEARAGGPDDGGEVTATLPEQVAA